MNYYTESDIKKIVESVVLQYTVAQQPSVTGSTVMVEASARHVHLTNEAVEALFGKGEKLTPKKYLSQPGEFLSEQRVKIVTYKGMLSSVAVLGPERSATQVELSFSDAKALDITLPINLSGNLNGAADVLLVGPCGVWQANGAAIAAKAHVHMTLEDAARYNVKDGDMISVTVGINRPVIFQNVVVRVSPKFALAVHIDIDEANACALDKDTRGTILNK